MFGWSGCTVDISGGYLEWWWLAGGCGGLFETF